jgi:hypothetical protein
MSETNPTRSTRLSDDLDDEFESFRDQNDMTTSEALRSLVKEGFEAKRSDPLDDRPDSRVAGLLWDARRDVHTFVLAGAVCFLVAQLVSGVVATGFLALAGGYALTITVATVDSLVLDSALLRRVTEAEGAGSGVEA